MKMYLKKTPSNIEYLLLDKIKGGRVFLCFPLLLDISSIDLYLLDHVHIRIRLELANQDWIIKSSKKIPEFGINISKAKLWIDRVTPHHNDMLALNHAMNTKPIVLSTYLIKHYLKYLLLEMENLVL